MVLLHRGGYRVSTSMVGRIIKCLKERGVLREPIFTPRQRRARERQRHRPYAIRKPKGYSVQKSGDVVQVDTLDLRPHPAYGGDGRTPAEYLIQCHPEMVPEHLLSHM